MISSQRKIIFWLGSVSIIVLLSVYGLLLVAITHPKTTPEYKEYFVKHSTLEWRTEHYPSQLADGLDFRRPGLPEWIATTYGLSFREPDGRWTDAAMVQNPEVILRQPLEGTQCVTLVARPAQPVLGKNVDVELGGERVTLKLNRGEFRDYQMQFTNLQSATTLTIFLPSHLPMMHPVQMPTNDNRRVGLQLKSLRIRPGECASGAPHDDGGPL